MRFSQKNKINIFVFKVETHGISVVFAVLRTVVFKKVMDQKRYKHFLLFHAAYRILCSDQFCRRYRNKANEYLKVFFRGMRKFYGIRSMVSTSHHLIYLAQDVKMVNCSLSRVTAFLFKRFLGKLKKYVRTPDKQ